WRTRRVGYVAIEAVSGTATLQHEWTAPDGNASEQTATPLAQAWLERLAAGELVQVASHDRDDATRAAWLVPVQDDQGLAGALVLESTASDQPWSEADATALQTIAHHLGTVLRQRRAAVLEQEQRELLQGVLDASVDS